MRADVDMDDMSRLLVPSPSESAFGVDRQVPSPANGGGTGASNPPRRVQMGRIGPPAGRKSPRTPATPLGVSRDIVKLRGSLSSSSRKRSRPQSLRKAAPRGPGFAERFRATLRQDKENNTHATAVCNDTETEFQTENERAAISSRCSLQTRPCTHGASPRKEAALDSSRTDLDVDVDFDFDCFEDAACWGPVTGPKTESNGAMASRENPPKLHGSGDAEANACKSASVSGGGIGIGIGSGSGISIGNGGGSGDGDQKKAEAAVAERTRRGEDNQARVQAPQPVNDATSSGQDPALQSSAVFDTSFGFTDEDFA